MDTESINTRKNVYYTNEFLTVRDLMQAQPTTVLSAARYKAGQDKVVQVRFTNIVVEEYASLTIFTCIDQSTGTAYFGTYDIRTKQFSFKLTRP